MAKTAIAPGALYTKTKELIALAIGITARCDGCLTCHSKAAARHEATRIEVLETIGVSIYMGGRPSMMLGVEALVGATGREILVKDCNRGKERK
ncbi:MAG: carboxymuconolactone decarboxylase family protein [Hyphomicrobiales bacterium]